MGLQMDWAGVWGQTNLSELRDIDRSSSSKGTGAHHSLASGFPL